jgi:uncharacterized membrane protein YraQ (UPF0718 family)
MGELFRNIFDFAAGSMSAAWQVLLDASFFILLGFIIAALIRAFISSETIVKYMGGRNVRSVLLSALFGVPLPLCSCGVVPTAVALRKQGASKPATLSFLITTPESSIDSIAITYALIDIVMTVFRPIAAFITGFIAGAAEIVLGKKDETVEIKADHCIHCEEEHTASFKHTIGERVKSGLHFAFVELLVDISRWFLIGMLIAGIITYAVPPNIVEQYLGSGWLSMFIMLAVGLPLYVCATASTPIAAALLLKGMSPGAALVFLLVGPATNAASFTVIAKTLGLRTAVIYIVSIAICAVLLGMLLNQFYIFFGIDITTSLGHAHEMIPAWLKWAAAVPLSAVMFLAALKRKNH